MYIYRTYSGWFTGVHKGKENINGTFDKKQVINRRSKRELIPFTDRLVFSWRSFLMDHLIKDKDADRQER